MKAGQRERAKADFDQCQLQDDLRLVRIDGQRVLVGLLGRLKPAAGEIGASEQRAETGERLGVRIGEPLAAPYRKRCIGPFGLIRGHDVVNLCI